MFISNTIQIKYKKVEKSIKAIILLILRLNLFFNKIQINIKKSNELKLDNSMQKSNLVC